ncbi:hypothetical protein CAEBREN_08899 [Caenorhabditis brenneri]|uniref:DUF7809 domain-containing protein n=1 Tax=Caenorhabditis brenneri TaxID=135651 RepID=G0MS73_CAEBE|nr:hypothetical protein CAEBREN_08899 [Caenorhabditis brenneri]
MSIVSYHNENRISSGPLMRLIFEYVPKEILRVPITQLQFGFLDFVQDDGNQLLQWILKNSSHHLRMYGSAKELAENLKIYRNFTGFMATIGADIIEPYSMPPVLHRSFTGKEYIIKQDLFVHLQDLLLKYFPDMECIVMLSMILIFLKTEESKLDRYQEFVHYDKEEFAKLEAEVADLEKYLNKPDSNCFPMASSYDLKVKNYTLSEILLQWKTILPFDWDDSRFDGVQAILSSVVEEVPRKEKPLFFKHRFHNLNVIIKRLKSIMDRRPLWFKPYDEENPNTPKMIKVYEDCGESFVLIMDVYATIGPACIEKLEEFKKEDGSDFVWGWKTISYDELRRRFPKECKTIEFIHTPVMRAKHRAVPIMDVDGDPSLFAADVLLELLRRMIFGAKLFQRVNSDKKVWGLITQFFENHYDKFGTVHTIYVLTVEHAAEINDEFEKTFRKYMEEELETVKPVRNAKKDGFTLDNLRNELKYLGLIDAFPNITNYVDVVYEHVSKNKKESVLRTCDLFDAVELCQLISIFKKFPRLAEFLHSQKSCHRILIECAICTKEKAEKMAKQVILEDLGGMKVDGSSEEEARKHQSETLKEKLSTAELKIAKLKREIKLAEEKEEKTMKAKIEQQRTEEMKHHMVKLQIAKVQQEAGNINKLIESNLQLEKQLESEHQIDERLQQEKKEQREMKAQYIREQEKMNERIQSEKHLLNSADDKELRKKNMRLKFQLEEREKTIKNLLNELS